MLVAFAMAPLSTAFLPHGHSRMVGVNTARQPVQFFMAEAGNDSDTPSTAEQEQNLKEMPDAVARGPEEGQIPAAERTKQGEKVESAQMPKKDK